jgi:hypothetical protein
MGQCIEAFDFFLYQPTVGQRKDIEHANSSKPRSRQGGDVYREISRSKPKNYRTGWCRSSGVAVVVLEP